MYIYKYIVVYDSLKEIHSSVFHYLNQHLPCFRGGDNDWRVRDYWLFHIVTVGPSHVLAAAGGMQ